MCRINSQFYLRNDERLIFMKKFKRLTASFLAAAIVASSVAGNYTKIGTKAAVMVENGFETTYEGFTNLGEMTSLEAVTDTAYNSLRSMFVSNRRTSADGACSNKGFYLYGGQVYDYSVWVYADTDETFKLGASYINGGETSGVDVFATVNARAGEWTELKGSYKAPASATDITVSLTTDSTSDFWFDDFLVTGSANATLNASAATQGLKDVYGKYFKFGTCVGNNYTSNSPLMALALREFNSFTCENELKPNQTIVQSGSTDTDIKVSLNNAASILDFAQKNNIGVRGHTFVWHNQTPDWFWSSNINGGGGNASVAQMNSRMESYIKNMFAAIKTQYPTLNLYAYDVVNEAFTNDGGGLRKASGETGGDSRWTAIYGDDTFIVNAFKYARQYAPASCKLFYNDYNEYIGAKTTDIINLVTKIKAQGNIDGIGMQSHLSISYPDNATYRTAVERFAATGLELQVTELDITHDNNNAALTQKYKDIMGIIMDNKENFTSVTVWGITDNLSWRSGNNPLLFDGSMNPKDAYKAVVEVAGKSSNSNDPKEDGTYFFSKFEDNDLDSWGNRGDSVTLKITAGKGVNGSAGLSISNRNQEWNGASRALPAAVFKAGQTFAFGGYFMFNEGPDTANIKLSLQCSIGGEEKYLCIAENKAAVRGEWTLLENTEYTIPAGATGAQIYVEISGQTIPFFVDELYGAVPGTSHPSNGNKPTAGTTEGKKVIYGDANDDGEVSIEDVVAVRLYCLKPDVYKLSEQGLKNALVISGQTTVQGNCAVAIQDYVVEKINTLPIVFPAN